MARFKDHPHPIINVKDESQVDVLITEDLPLHRPLFLSFAEKGKPNEIQYGTYSELIKKVGEGTFDEFSPYFKHPNLFMRLAAQNQPIFFSRLVPDDAETASEVIEAHVWNADIPQWVRDVNGRFITDVIGDKIPLINDPDIVSIDWDNWNQVESTAYILTVTATDPNSLDLTYDIVCNDANVVVTPRLHPNEHMFDITYGEYDIDTNIEYTILVTDTDHLSDSMAENIIVQNVD